MAVNSSTPVRKSTRTRERILAAATEEFRERGYAEARMSDIADRAELQTASLYYHFDSKDALIEAVLASVVDRVFTHVQQCVDRVGTADPARRLRVAVEAHLEKLLESGSARAETVRMLGQMPESVRRNLVKRQRALMAYWTELVRDAQEAGAVRGDLDPQILSQLVLGAMVWSTEWYRPGDQTIADVARHTTAAFLMPGG
jgi:TetR/AcrR family transcriptional regulator, cholesterol catabolism regulator